jgi:hypothetical protein
VPAREKDDVQNGQGGARWPAGHACSRLHAAGGCWIHGPRLFLPATTRAWSMVTKAATALDGSDRDEDKEAHRGLEDDGGSAGGRRGRAEACVDALVWLALIPHPRRGGCALRQHGADPSPATSRLAPGKERGAGLGVHEAAGYREAGGQKRATAASRTTTCRATGVVRPRPSDGDGREVHQGTGRRRRGR